MVLRVPDFFIRFTLWMLTHTIYRITIVGRPNIPLRGPALIVSNHVSVVDGGLVGASLQRFVRFMVYGPYFRLPVVNWLMRRMHAIPVTAGTRREVIAALERARAELAAGHVVCIFAEGAISRTGNLLPFQRGFERIVKGLDVPIVPVYLDRVWGSVFSFKRGKFFWKLPERLPYPVTVAWGTPLPSTATATEVRQAITELGSTAMSVRREPSTRLHVEFMRSARRRWSHLAMADTTGQKLTYGRALIGAVRIWTRARTTHGGPGGGRHAAAGVGRRRAGQHRALHCRQDCRSTSTSRSAVNRSTWPFKQAGIKTILTSRKFLEKASLPEMPGMVFLEDLRKEVTGKDKLLALMSARFTPMSILAHRYGPRRDAKGNPGDDHLLERQHRRAQGRDAHARQRRRQRRVAGTGHPGVCTTTCFIGVLPFFHCFGYTVTLWLPLLVGATVVYHPNPLDAKRSASSCEKHKCDDVPQHADVPARAYLRRVRRNSSRISSARSSAPRSCRAASPRVQGEVRRRAARGLRLHRAVAGRRRQPPERRSSATTAQVGNKPGTIGHPLPGVAAKIVDPETRRRSRARTRKACCSSTGRT